MNALRTWLHDLLFPGCFAARVRKTARNAPVYDDDALLDALASCQDCNVGEPHVCPALGVDRGDFLTFPLGLIPEADRVPVSDDEY